MELKLSKEEVEHILLQWAKAQFKDEPAFNEVDFDSSYNTVRHATLSYTEPTPDKGKEQ